jgi:RES domain-containing protein
LDKLAHVDPAALPGDLLLGHFAGEPSIEAVTEALEVGDLAACRAHGERFLEAARACALRVPSAVLPEETNYLVNALHPEAGRISLVSERSFSFDERLVA